MDPLKIVHLVEDLGPGGREKVIYDICTRMDKGRYDNRVVCLAAEGKMAERIRAKGVQVTCAYIKGYYNPFNVIKLYLLLKVMRPDVLHTHGYFASTAGRAATLFMRKRPVWIKHVHSVIHGMGLRNIFIDKAFDMLTERTIYLSQAAKDSFSGKGYKNDKAEVIYNGVDTREFRAPERKEYGPKLITCGSLTPHKGHKFLIEAMGSVIKDIPGVSLVILGAGPLEEELKKEAEKNGVQENVTFCGLVDDVAGEMRSSSLFVLPSLREGLSLALLEAMSSGLPVIASDTGGIPEAVTHGFNGFLVPPGDSRRLASAVKELLEDPDAMRKMGQRGRERAEKAFTVEKMIERTRILYEVLTGREGEG
jgi:glycosyltransferase involved in cell wall biosynthesis